MLIDIWVVYQGGDDRSYGTPTYFFTNEDLAHSKAQGTGWYGCEAHVEKRKAVRIDSKYYLIDSVGEIDLDGKYEAYSHELRQQVMAKLTPAEKAALGIKS